MKDKYLGMIVLGCINMACVFMAVEYAKEIVMMTVPVLAAIIRD